MILPWSKPRQGSLLPIFVTVFLDLLGLGIIIPVLAPILFDPASGVLPPAHSLGTRALVLGLLAAAYPLAQFFGAPLLGGWSDRVGRKRVLLVSLAGTMAGYVLFALGVLTASLPLLFLSRLLDGFTGGNISTAMSAIADLSDEKSKAKNFGLIGMAFGLGFILGPYLGGKLSDPAVVPWFSYATPFWFAALLALANIALVQWRFKETLRAPSRAEVSWLTGFRNLGRALQLPALRSMFVVVFLLTFGFTFFTQFFQVFLIEKFSFTQSAIGDLFAFTGVWIAFTQGVLARLVAPRFQPRQVLVVALLLLGLTFPLLLLPERPWGLYVILPFVAIFNGLIQPNTTAVISDLSDAQSQGEILGINQSVQSLAFAVPPVVSGLVINISLDLPIILAALSCLAAWAVFVVFIFIPHARNRVFHQR